MNKSLGRISLKFLLYIYIFYNPWVTCRSLSCNEEPGVEGGDAQQEADLSQCRICTIQQTRPSDVEPFERGSPFFWKFLPAPLWDPVYRWKPLLASHASPSAVGLILYLKKYFHFYHRHCIRNFHCADWPITLKNQTSCLCLVRFCVGWFTKLMWVKLHQFCVT